MRWTLMIFVLLITHSTADPDPKKYKSEQDVKSKENKKLTNEEKEFLREIEAKFGVKSETPIDSEVSTNEDNKSDEIDGESKNLKLKAPFPAVIAIEIVNDTNSKFKGKRTIDANLGYGYKTNEGYSYSYTGQNKAKFMIYPYSQHDIPPKFKVNTENYARSPSSDASAHAVDVDIQPSQAYELVEVEDEKSGYNYEQPTNPLKTKYEEVKQTASAYETETPSQTLYTTYDGQSFSGLSKQFPTVMPNYFVDPKQLLHNSHYQTTAITRDHVSSPNPYLAQNQRVVPVLVLRVPSSFLKTPTAELYADLPKNYPLSHYINNVNLQQLVNQYFRKNGFSFAPQIMTYQSSPLLAPTVHPANHAGQYSNSYVSKPSYTSSVYSGVQYSGVNPTVARYPSNYQQQYVTSQSQLGYQQPIQYQYKYQYEPRVNYEPVQYQQETSGETTYNDYQNNQAGSHVPSSNLVYEVPHHYNTQEDKSAAQNYGSALQTENVQSPYQVSSDTETAQYESDKGESSTTNTDYGPIKVSLPAYTDASQYYSGKTSQKDPVSVVPSRLIHTEQYDTNPTSSAAYGYQQNSQSNDAATSYETYPSKHHTAANAVPFGSVYQSGKSQALPSSSAQTVSYVTPTPSAKYQSQYQVMVPQTVLKYPSGDKLYNANRLLAMHYLQQNSHGQGYKGVQYKPSKTVNYPMHYVYAKRMVKQNNKSEGSSKKTNKSVTDKTVV